MVELHLYHGFYLVYEFTARRAETWEAWMHQASEPETETSDGSTVI